MKMEKEAKILSLLYLQSLFKVWLIVVVFQKSAKSGTQRSPLIFQPHPASTRGQRCDVETLRKVQL